MDDAEGETAEKEKRAEREGAPDGVMERRMFQKHQQFTQLTAVIFVWKRVIILEVVLMADEEK